MALGWDPSQGRRWFHRGGNNAIDLNAAALLCGADRILDVVYHEQLLSQDGAVRHLGDSTDGEGEGDDESIFADLTRLTPEVTTVIFLVTSYSGQTFGEIENAFCRVLDPIADAEIIRYDLSAGGTYTGLVVGSVFRAADEWQFRPIGEGIQAGHPVEAVPHLAPYLV